MKTKVLTIVLGLCIAVSLMVSTAYAEEEIELNNWRPEAAGPTFAEIVNDSANVVFGQVTSVSNTNLRVSVSLTLKGNAHDEIIVTGLKKLKSFRKKETEKEFKSGEDYFFFLGAAIVGSVPFEPVRNSVVIKVDRGKLQTSILSPAFPKYYKELDFKTFKKYLQNIVAVQANEDISPVFLGTLKEELEKISQDPNNKDAVKYLQMILHLEPMYKNETVLFSMMDSKDINARLLSMQTLANLVLLQPKDDIAKDKKKGKKGKKYKKKKKRKGRRGKKEPDFKTKVISKIVEKMKSDSSTLVKSLAAGSLVSIHDPKTIREIGDLVEKADNRKIETCEFLPIIAAEPNMTAFLRAIVEFDDDRALDVLERELLKNKVETFRTILEVFKDYADVDLNLLLLDLLQDRNFLPRQVAILEYFRRIKDDETIESLKEVYLSPDAGSEYIRKSIIEVFENYKEPKLTADFLVKYGLHDKSAVVRQAASRALGTMGAKAAVKEFRKIYFAESNRLAREFYVEALSKIKSKDAYECLKWLLTKETDKRMRNQIKFALKKSKYLSQY